MDAEQPTAGIGARPGTDHDREDATTRRRGVVGLPARLALVTVAAIVACVAGIALYSDHRLRDDADQQVRLMAQGAATDAATLISEETGGDAIVSSGALDQMLLRLREHSPDVRAIAVASSEPGSPVQRAATSEGERAGTLADRALRAKEDLRVSMDGSRAFVAVPSAVLGEGTSMVVAVEYDATPLMADLRQSRLRLGLAALFGGCMLGAILLLLLRRELFRPLDEMRRVMGQIRGGATGARIGWNRSDELGAVAAEFDAMVADLEAARAELATYVNCDPLTGLLTRDAFTDRFSAELTRARREGYPVALLAIDIDALDELNRTHDRKAGDQVLADIGSVIAGCTRPTDACGRTGGDSFHVALVGAEASQAAVVIDRIRAEIAQRVGIGPDRTRVTCSYGVAEYPQHAVDQIALERMATAACGQAQRTGRDHALAFGPAGGYVDAMSLVPEEERRSAGPAGAKELASTVHALARALDGIDPALGGSAHSQRVARYAAAVARELGIGDGDMQMRELRSAAVLHDVGKVAVPPSILRVPEEELDERQRGARRYHAWVSRTMIAGAGLPSVADAVFHLPERFDGTGYPERLREGDIPLSSRILRAAELLDDLTTGQGGREAMTPFRAAGELKRRAGSELDPDVAVTLARLVREEGLVGNEPAVGTEPGDAEAA